MTRGSSNPLPRGTFLEGGNGQPEKDSGAVVLCPPPGIILVSHVMGINPRADTQPRSAAGPLALSSNNAAGPSHTVV